MSLARVLKEARTRKDLSLRDVEARVKISNGYLSQLESGRVKRPSPVHLFALAELYRISYTELMKLAGYVPASSAGGTTGVAFSGSEELTVEQRKAVQEMIDILRKANLKGAE